MESKILFTRDELIGVRCVCIIGIILTHSYIPGLYATGYLWRVPILFLLGGLSLIPSRETKDTAIHIFKSYYIYTCISSIIYMTILYFIYDGSANHFIKKYDIFNVFYNDMFRKNNHYNALILGAWFLVPYSLALLTLTTTKNSLGLHKRFYIPSIIILFAISLYLVESNEAPWRQRLTAQTAVAMGFMLLGYFIFTNNFMLNFVRNGWTIFLATLGAFWIWSAFDRPGII